MPGQTAYSILPLRQQKGTRAAMEKKGVELGYVPPRTQADQIARDVLDNSVKKYKQAQRFEASKRRKLFFAVGGAVLLVLVVVAVALAVTLSKRHEASPAIEGLLGVPAADPGDNVVYIRYNKSDPESYKAILAELNYTWLRYERRGSVRPGLDSSCNGSEACTADLFDLGTLGPYCSKDKLYGYDKGMPCVLLVLKIPTVWDPQRCLVAAPLNPSLSNVTTTAATTTTPSSDDIKVTCKPVANAAKTKYYPSFGFARSILKQRTLAGYMDPLVMVRFPSLPYGQEVSILCSVCPGYSNRPDATPEVYKIQITVSVLM